MKNIIVCCDGTNNQFSGCHTNVIRTYKVVEGMQNQTCYYDPGVGTIPLAGFVTKAGQFLSIVAGLAYGAGLIDDVEEAYRFLMKVYEPGDHVYLFGFSRGAFTVRALAGMLHSVGLLFPDSDQLVPYATRYWRQFRGAETASGAVCAEFKATLARDCPIHFIGVWDTVSSVGLINLFRHDQAFPFTQHNPQVTHVRHAVSIDERRCFFRQNLMLRWHPEQDIKNVWFAGVHSDVGGGYPAGQSGLSKLAFEWMMVEARKAGLAIDTSGARGDYSHELSLGQGPDSEVKPHKSLHGLWWMAEILWVRHFSMRDRKYHWRPNLGRPRNVQSSQDLPGTAIHASVLKRMQLDPTYRPRNLPGSSEDIARAYAIEARVPMA